MKRKLSKIVIFLFCVVLFFGLFYWDTWKANTITYQEFEQKIYAQNFEKIVVNTKRNNVLLYEKETKRRTVSLYSIRQMQSHRQHTRQPRTFERRITNNETL